MDLKSIAIKKGLNHNTMLKLYLQPEKILNKVILTTGKHHEAEIQDSEI